MFGPEDHVPGPDLQDGGRLEGRGDGEQGELRRAAALAVAPHLTVEELESTLDVERLRGAEQISIHDKKMDLDSSP